MTSKRSKLQEDTHFRMLRLLQDNPEMSQRELAEAVGISVGGTHYVLNALIEKGFMKLGNFTAAEDKRRYAYVLTPKGIKNKSLMIGKSLKRNYFSILTNAFDPELNSASIVFFGFSSTLFSKF